MKKYLIISLLFVVLINSGAGCGNSSDQVVMPAPNYFGTWGTNEDACAGGASSTNEETLEITEKKIIYLQPELTAKNCQGLATAQYGLKAEYTYIVDKDVIKITPTGIVQKLSGGVLTEIVAADKAAGFAQYLATQLFNKELSSKFTCDGKTLKFDTFGNPTYVKRK